MPFRESSRLGLDVLLHFLGGYGRYLNIQLFRALQPYFGPRLSAGHDPRLDIGYFSSPVTMPLKCRFPESVGEGDRLVSRFSVGHSTIFETRLLWKY